ncbi:MAG: leucine-rich repeat domain-containing protein [Ruminococcus sp.]|nr:leucine-rich repeat domain-containing protein [Ruminococcus sp.]
MEKALSESIRSLTAEIEDLETEIGRIKTQQDSEKPRKVDILPGLPPKANEKLFEDFDIENGILKIYKGNGGDVVIPDTVIRIGERAFKNCSSLVSITIPDSVKSIGEDAFSCTKWLENYPDDFVIINEILIKYKGNAKYVTIPDSVTNIGKNTFWSCSSLKSITIPKDCQIEEGAFDSNIKVNRRQ